MSDKIKIMIQQAEKTSSKLDIKVVYRSDKDGELNDKDMDFLLNQLKNADVFALDNLHSKCYLNENTAIITSMNLYQHSQENNWEMGIKIDKSTESDIYEKISGHVSYILVHRFRFISINFCNIMNII
jgi:phosphatidylserine/phosphatidylglycerophosphate/cardiolipin synthase-like enzyme